MKRVSKLFAMLIAAVGNHGVLGFDTSTDGENFYVSYGESLVLLNPIRLKPMQVILFTSLKTCCQLSRWKMVCVYE